MSGFPVAAADFRLVDFWAKSFRLPAAAESLFSCVAKRKVTKREGHPAWRLPGIHARQVREPGPGFSTAHPCAGEKESASCRFPLRGLSSPTHRRTGAPGRAAGHPGPHSVRSGCAAAKALPAVPVDLASASASVFAFDWAFSRVRAGCAQPFRGPYAAVRDERQARRVVGRDADHFSPGQDALPKNPASPHGLAAHGWAASAKWGGLSLWLAFSLATQRESNSASVGGRKLVALKLSALKEATTSKSIATEVAPTGSAAA